MKKEVEIDTKILDETYQAFIEKHKKKLKEIEKMAEHREIINKIAKGEIK